MARTGISTLRRRLAGAAGRERQPHAPATPAAPPPQAPPAAEPDRRDGADDARLDALRGELVRELDRLAAAEVGCSASFRRI